MKAIMRIVLLLGALFASDMECGSLFKERAVESRQDLPCCQDENLLSCHQVDLDVDSLGDQDLELAPFNTTVQYQGLVEGSQNSYHYENDLVDMILTVHNGDIYGHMAIDNGDSYVVEYCGNGVHVFKQLDVDNLGENIGEEDEPSLDEEEGNNFLRSLTPEQRQDTTTIVTYTVKVYYTPEFAAVTADIEGFIEQVIQETNQGYINSKVPLRAAAICSEQATINDKPTSKEMLSAFKSMKGNSEALRGSADVAALLVRSFDSCGRGYLNTIGSGSTISVTAKSCALGYYSFGHELGHNIGLMHNKEAGSNGMYDHGHGYLIAKGSHSTGFRTILAYNADGHRTRVNYYSNPDVLYPTTGTATGVTGVANNARILTDNRFALAAVGDESQCESYPIDPECILNNVTFTDTSRVKGYLGFTQEDCMELCQKEVDCYEWNRRVSGACYIRLMVVSYSSLGNTMLDIKNPKCILKKECKVNQIRWQSYSVGSYETKDAKECHLKCESDKKCKYWYWNPRTNHCGLNSDTRGIDENWVTSSKFC
jgi:hypothetical protein